MTGRTWEGRRGDVGLENGDGFAFDGVVLLGEPHEGKPELFVDGEGVDECFPVVGFEVASAQEACEQAALGKEMDWDFADQDIFVTWVVGEQC